MLAAKECGVTLLDDAPQRRGFAVVSPPGFADTGLCQAAQRPHQRSDASRSAGVSVTPIGRQRCGRRASEVGIAREPRGDGGSTAAGS